jgi:hypothetical protein
MFNGKFEGNPSAESDLPYKEKIAFCPHGHENPCAWRNACLYCDELCKKEIELIEAEERRRKSAASRKLPAVDD